MIKKLLFCFLLFTNISQGQNTIGTMSITEDAYEGYTLVSINTKALLIDNCGQLIREWSSQYLPGNSVYLMPNGNILRAGRLNDGSSDIGFGGQGGIVEMFDWEGNLIWSFTHSSNQFRQHHEAFPLPNGNVLIIAANVINEADAIQAGRDPNKLDESELYNERIFEIEPVGATGGNIIWEWNAIDHVIQDFDATKDNFGVVADNPQKIDINFLNGFDAENNWLHINSIQYNEERDQIVISPRRMSEIWIIDHNTTTSEAAGSAGDLLYRWGNPQAYRQGTEDDRKLYGQHTPYFIPSGLPNEGKIMLFNNGFGRLPIFSEVFIINPPEIGLGEYEYTPGTAYGPTNTDFTFPEVAPTNDSDFYSAIVSNAQQLPNGNILVCEGREAYFFELDENNDIVWEYQSPISNTDGTAYAQGGPAPINAFSFRALKYSLDYSAFTGRDLTPGLPLETNPDLTPCNNLSVENFDATVVRIYPNPTSNSIQIKSTLQIDKIEVYNILGAKVSETQYSNIDLSEQTNGIYFLRIYSESIFISKKVIKN
jgi:hypothetical protein